MKARIVRNPKILGGKPVIAGTRITVTLILNLLAHGMNVEEIMDEYDLTEDQVRTALLFNSPLSGQFGKLESDNYS